MKDKTRLVVYAATAVIVLILASSGLLKNSRYGFPGIREGYFYIQGAVKAPFVFITEVFSNYVLLVGTKKENSNLKKKITELNTRQMATRDIINENMRLRKMLAMKEAWTDIPLTGADIISQDISLMFKSVIINRGTASGFYANMPIVQPEGLVGRVISVSADTSQVLLITDTNSSIPAVVETGRIKGIIKGLGNGKLSFDYVRSDEEIKTGDRIITSGLLGIFPKGLFIGTVISIKRLENRMFAEIIVKPAFVADKSGEVFGIGRILEK